MKKGLYLLTDPKLLEPGTGAYQHIQIGFHQLSQYYDMELLKVGSHASPGKAGAYVNKETAVPVKQKGLKSKLLAALPRKLHGTLKYVHWLIKNNIRFYSLYKTIKQKRPDFIYERCCILDFRGVIIARKLGIPHFYENNGILVYQYHENFFSSYIKSLLLRIEQWSHKSSDFVFYVGTWGNVFNNSKKNWMNIENGIEAAWVQQNAGLKKQIDNHVIHCCVLGHLMKHHNVDILIDALNKQATNKRLNISFVGSVQPDIWKLLNESLTINNVEIDHRGILNRDALLQLLRGTHVGIITGAHAYQSMMKLFDYGAAKCLVIAPDTFNLTYWFSNEEVLFFREKDSDSLAGQLTLVAQKPAIIMEYGEKLYNTIQDKFTWDKIFGVKVRKINRLINNNQRGI